MDGFLTANEAAVRLAATLGILAVMAAWEFAAPRRRREIPLLLRWPNNFAVALVNAALVRLLFPGFLAALAMDAAADGRGLLNMLDVPFWLAVLLSLLAFDLLIYLQHLVFHKVGPLWRLHRMHHADQAIDVSTALRFHPLEILLSVLIKAAAVIALGPPAVAVLLFEVILNGTAMFNHGNVRLPAGLDRWLRLVVVTPDMHRVHHSIHRDETDSNYGFNLPWWDRLFGTYRPQPRDGHDAMSIGVDAFRTRRDQWLDRMLWQPLRRR